MNQPLPARIALFASDSPTAPAFLPALAVWSGSPPAVVATNDNGDHGRAVRGQLERLSPELLVVPGMRVRPEPSWSAEPYYAGHSFEADVLRAAAATGVRRILYVADSHVVRSGLTAPVSEAALLEPQQRGREGYEDAVRMAGLRRCQYARTTLGLEVTVVVPALVYDGRRDDPSPVGIARHALAADGDGRRDLTVALRAGAVWDLVHVDDVVAAALHVLESAPGETVNVGSGEGITTEDLLAAVVAAARPGTRVTVVGDGAGPEPLPVLDTTRLRALGFAPRRSLRERLASVGNGGAGRSVVAPQECKRC